MNRMSPEAHNTQPTPVVVEVIEVEPDGSTNETFWKQVDTDYEVDPEYDDATVEEIIATPEIENSPQMDWPESGPEGIPTEEQYLARCNYRLSQCGFLLDAARMHIDPNEDSGLYDKWLQLKAVVQLAKGEGDPYRKIDLVIAIESEVYDFSMPLGVTESEYSSVQS